MNKKIALHLILILLAFFLLSCDQEVPRISIDLKSVKNMTIYDADYKSKDSNLEKFTAYPVEHSEVKKIFKQYAIKKKDILQ